jgi:hypothetical protein
MFNIDGAGEPGGGTVPAQLGAARDELNHIRHRLVLAEERLPAREASGWEGAAAIAYRLARASLLRELEVAGELLRSASDLTSAALVEVGGSV